MPCATDSMVPVNGFKVFKREASTMLHRKHMPDASPDIQSIELAH